MHIYQRTFSVSNLHQVLLAASQGRSDYQNRARLCTKFFARAVRAVTFTLSTLCRKTRTLRDDAVRPSVRLFVCSSVASAVY